MRKQNKSVNWRIGYAVCCLAYTVWVVYLSLNNFDMVNSRYRAAREKLQPDQVREIALQELIDQCRKEAKPAARPPVAGEGQSTAGAEPCLSPPAAVLDERQKSVHERLVHEKTLAVRKLVLFYVFYGILFLVLPLVLLYLWFRFCIWLYRTLRPAR